jgi:large subunit ribosomal protein L9
MKVVLLKTVSKLGRRGEVKNVALGFFRNYLAPRTLALAATPGRIRQAEDRKSRAAKSLEEVRKNAVSIAEKLDGSVVQVSGKATPKGKLYASITMADVLDAVEKQLKIKLSDGMLSSHDHIKNVGKTLVPVQLSDEVKASISVEVVASKK